MGKQREEGRDGILGRRLVDLSLGVGTGRLHCQIDGQRLPGRGSGCGRALAEQEEQVCWGDHRKPGRE